MTRFRQENRGRFRRERRFIADLPFTYLHCSLFGRPGTPAAEDSGCVPMAVRKERNRALRELATAKKSRVSQKHGGEDALRGDAA